MACSNCGAKIAREWLFCPFCGFEIRKSGGLLDSIDKVVRSVMKGISGGVLSDSIDGNKFTIKIDTFPSEEASSKRVQDERVIKLPSNLIEPEVVSKRFSDFIEFSISLPGVKSLSEVNVKVLSESLELRAATRDNGYFKIIKIPFGYRIINKSLRDESLMMRLGAK